MKYFQLAGKPLKRVALLAEMVVVKGIDGLKKLGFMMRQPEFALAREKLEVTTFCKQFGHFIFFAGVKKCSNSMNFMGIRQGPAWVKTTPGQVS
jgi:hypothetical protein